MISATWCAPPPRRRKRTSGTCRRSAAASACSRPARGYLAEASFLLPAEVEELVFSGRLITLTIAIRFLTDYLSGDVYFRTHRPGQNLDRCRTQLQMVRSMEAQAEAMEKIVREVGGSRA